MSLALCPGLPAGANGCAAPDAPVCTLFLDPRGAEADAGFGTALAAWDWLVPPDDELGDGWIRPPIRHALFVGAPASTAQTLSCGAPGAEPAGSVRGMTFDWSSPARVSAWWTVDPRLPHDGSLQPCDLSGGRFGASLAVGRFHEDFLGQWPGAWLKRPQQLAVGAPGTPLRVADAAVPDVGAVHVFGVPQERIQRGGLPPAPLPYAILDNTHPSLLGPGTFVSTFITPSRVCPSGPEEPEPEEVGACIAEVVGPGSLDGICAGAGYGTALTAGRLIEDSRTTLRDELVVGAPGSPGRFGQPGSGVVEILSGSTLRPQGLGDPALRGSDCGDDIVLDSWRWATPAPGSAAAVGAFAAAPGSDREPEPADGFGSSLAVAELVRTIRSNDRGHMRHELVIGVPGESVTVWDPTGTGPPGSVAPLGTWTEDAITSGGMVCVVSFSEADLEAVWGGPGGERGGAWSRGFPPDQQQCFSLAATDGAPAFGDGAFERARLGASVLAGRVSAWDDDVQIVAGAPGTPHVNLLNERQLAGEGAGGAVYMFHLRSIFNGGVTAGWEPTDDVSYQPVRRTVVPGPAVELGTATGPLAPGQSAALPEGFGSHMLLADRTCSGHPELLVAAPTVGAASTIDTRGVDDIYLTRWKPRREPDPTWDGVYRWTSPPNEPIAEELWLEGVGVYFALSVDISGSATGPAAGEVPADQFWTWSPSNAAAAYTAGVEPSCFLPGACGDGQARHTCLNLPFNLPNIPMRHPLVGDSGMLLPHDPGVEPDPQDELLCADPLGDDDDSAAPDPGGDRPHPVSWAAAQSDSWAGTPWPRQNLLDYLGGSVLSPSGLQSLQALVEPARVASVAQVLGPGRWQSILNAIEPYLLEIEAMVGPVDLQPMSMAWHLLKDAPAMGPGPIALCVDFDVTVDARLAEDPTGLDAFKWINWELAPTTCDVVAFPAAEDLAVLRFERVGEFDCDRAWTSYP